MPGKPSITPPRYTRTAGIPETPAWFVERPDTADAVRLALEGGASGALTTVLSALHGLGGVGKTTLAAKFVERLADSGTFPDGIFWLTLGEDSTESQRLAWLGDLARFFGDGGYQAREIAPASAHLRGLLRGKQVLLVVDDAWAAEHVEPFRVVDKTGRILVTTRDTSVVRGVAPIDLDAMSPAEARSLIEGRLGRSLRPEEEANVVELADELGRLPLALELAAAQVIDGVPWIELLEATRKEVADLRVFEPPDADDEPESIQRRLSIRASFRLSLRRLSFERRERFAWLGVFQEDASLAPGHLMRLWSCDLRDARDTLRYLRDKAVLTRGVPLPDGTLTFRLHDLMRHEAIRLLTSPVAPEQASELPGLALTLPEAHGRYLDRSRNRADAPWHAVPDDGYLYDHLIWHLEQAKRVDEIHDLLWTEDEAGKNGWHEARVSHGQLPGFFTDVERAWQLADDDFARDSSPTSMIRQIRCALIRVSCLALKIPPEILKAGVESRILTVEAGLTYARCNPDPAQGIESRIALLSKVDAASRRLVVSESLNATLSICNEGARTQALGALAPMLDESQRARIRDIVPANHQEPSRAQMPRTSLPPIDALLYDRIHHAASEIRYALRQIQMDPSLLSTIRWPMRLRAMDAVFAIRGEVHLIQELASTPQTRVIDHALEIAFAIRDESSQARALGILAPTLDAIQRARALDAALAIRDGLYRAQALAALAPTLDALQRARALDGVRAIHDGPSRAQALAALAPTLDVSQRDRVIDVALNAALTSREGPSYIRALRALAPMLDATQRARALNAALAPRGRPSRAQALVALAPTLDATQRVRAFHAALAIGEESSRAEALVALIPTLDDRQRVRAFDAALAIRGAPSRASRARALAALAPTLDVAQRGRALDAALAIGDESLRARTLSELVSTLDATQRALALKAALAIRDGLSRVQALTALAPTLDKPERARTLDAALDAALAISGESPRAQALGTLAPMLDGPQRARALDAALAIRAEPSRAQALRELAPVLDTKGQRRILDSIPSFDDQMMRSRLVAVILPHIGHEDCEFAKRIFRRDWPSLLHFIAQASSGQSVRVGFVRDLTDKLRETLEAIGGRSFMNGLAEAIIAVGRWWP